MVTSMSLFQDLLVLDCSETMYPRTSIKIKNLITTLKILHCHAV